MRKRLRWRCCLIMFFVLALAPLGFLVVSDHAAGHDKEKQPAVLSSLSTNGS